MATQRNSYSAEFKARVALEALKGHKTINELVSHFGVHPTQINKWKNHLPNCLRCFRIDVKSASRVTRHCKRSSTSK
jgi:hypothetical protein